MGFYDKKNPPVKLSLYAGGLDYIKNCDVTFWGTLFERMRKELNIRDVEVATYSHDQDNIFKDIDPWIKTNREYNLRTFDKNYFNPWFEFATIARNNGIKLTIIPFFGARANRPFLKNCNGVNGMYSDGALRFELRFIKRFVKVLERSKVRYSWRGGNEDGRGYNREQDVKMNHYFSDWFRATGSPIRKWSSDITFNDFLHLCEVEFVLEDWQIVTPQQYAQMPEPKPKVIDTMGDDAWDRKSTIQQHGFGTIQDLRERTGGEAKPIWNILLGSGWGRKGRLELNSDGSVTGDIHYSELWDFTDTSLQELFNFCLIAWLEAKDARKKLTIIDLPKGCFFRNADDKIEERFQLLLEDSEQWDRLRAINEAWKEVRG